MPVRALSRRFRGTCKVALTTAGRYDPVPPQVWHQDGVTHCQPAGTGTEVLTDFAPSLSRIALTNNRLETLEDGHVTFRVKQRSGAGWHRLTRPAAAFIHRFLQHVLPKGCPTVRSYGFLSPSRRTVLPQLRPLVAACPRNAQFENIARLRREYETAGDAVMSIDTKKKEWPRSWDRPL